MTHPLMMVDDDTGYSLTRSLRWRNSASAYLNRTPASATNRQTWTYSAWVKLTPVPQIGGFESWLLSTKFNGVAPYATKITIGTDYKLTFASYDGSGGSPSLNLVTTQVFRDYSSWYHIVVVADTTQATAANRAKIYVNGIQITSFSTATYPAQNYNTYVNNNDVTVLGALYYSGGGAYAYYSFYDGYIAEQNLIDGQALTPSSFGSTNALTGVWQPARYTGTYGTNGFYLPFTDNSALTTSSNVGLGKDFSGNGNYWTTNNISITAGVTYDSMTDVPTLTDASTANFPTISAVDYNSTYITLSNGNLRQTYAGVSAAATSRATMAIPSTGKFYWEVYLTTIGTNTTTIKAGICRQSTPISGNSVEQSATSYMVITTGQKRNNFIDTTYGASFSNGQTLQVLYDATSGAIYFGQNNSFANGSGSFNHAWATASAAFTSLSGEFIPFFVTYGGSDISVNFGQRPFTYTPPTGFVALNTFNLPTSTIVKGNTNFDVVLRTGGAPSGGTYATTLDLTQGGLLWDKGRSAVSSNNLVDSVRGISKFLISNSTAAEGTDANFITAFNNGSFQTGTSDYASSVSLVDWIWKAGGTASSNTNGSITSTVSVNASAGFSVVTYTGNGTNPGATIGHGLGVAPAMIICKNRSNIDWWPSYHVSAGITNTLYLNDTVKSNTYLNRFSAVSSTTFTTGVSGSELNTSANNYVASCWTPISGYSAFGSYTGNGSADGVFVYTGFKPRWITIKRTDTADDWYTIDTARNPYNYSNLFLFPNSSSAESAGTITWMDILSNGFKLRNTGINANGGTFIYMAFAENPFKNALAR
jgi:hypothetical protein